MLLQLLHLPKLCDLIFKKSLISWTPQFLIQHFHSVDDSVVVETNFYYYFYYYYCYYYYFYYYYYYTLLLLLCSRPTAPRSPAASQYIVLRPRQALILSKRFQTAFPKIKKTTLDKIEIIWNLNCQMSRGSCLMRKFQIFYGRLNFFAWKELPCLI